MSSLEMVDYINSMRQPGEAELQYGHFMVKVPKVLGELTAFKFSQAVQYSSGNGATSTRQVFNFPKREACLMAMSYSYDLQAKVFDRMTALEAALVAAPAAIKAPAPSLQVPSKATLYAGCWRCLPVS